MKKIKTNRIYQIIYPLFTYYIVYNLSAGIFKMVFEETYGNLFALFLAGLLTLIPIIVIYRSVPKLISDKTISFKKYLTYLIYIFITVLIGIVLNIIISKSGLISNSTNFTIAKSTLSDGTIVLKILCNAIIIPILEEILYRGIILGQLCYMVSYKTAIFISSICFGILHFNIVQFLYAFIMGLILGYFFYKSNNLYVSIISHALLNLIVIIFT